MKKENNIVNFPSNLISGEREVEAIIFSAEEPLDIETIEKRVGSQTGVKKSIRKFNQWVFW